MRVSRVPNADFNVNIASGNASMGALISSLLPEETRTRRINQTVIVGSAPLLDRLLVNDTEAEMTEVVSRLRATHTAIGRSRPPVTRRLTPLGSPPTVTRFNEAFGVDTRRRRRTVGTLLATVREAASSLPLGSCYKTSICCARVAESLRRAITDGERRQIGESVLSLATREYSQPSVVSRVLDTSSSSRGDSYDRAVGAVFKVLTSRYSRPFRSSSPSVTLPNIVSESGMDWTLVVESGVSCPPALKDKLLRIKDTMCAEPQPGISSLVHIMTSAVTALNCLDIDDISQMPSKLWLRIRVQILHDIERCILTNAPDSLRCRIDAAHTDALLNELAEDSNLESDDPLVEVMQQLPGTRINFMRNVFDRISFMDASVPVISDPNDLRTGFMLQGLRFSFAEYNRNFMNSSPRARMALLSAPIARLDVQEREILGAENLRVLIHEAHDMSMSVQALSMLPLLVARMAQNVHEDPQKRHFTDEEVKRLREGENHWLKPLVTTENTESGSSELGACAPSTSESKLTCQICFADLNPEQHEALRTYAAQWNNDAHLPKEAVVPLNEGLRANYCGHFFHSTCLEKWSARCAVCRAPWFSESEDSQNDENCRVS